MESKQLYATVFSPLPPYRTDSPLVESPPPKTAETEEKKAEEPQEPQNSQAPQISPPSSPPQAPPAEESPPKEEPQQPSPPPAQEQPEEKPVESPSPPPAEEPQKEEQQQVPIEDQPQDSPAPAQYPEEEEVKNPPAEEPAPESTPVEALAQELDTLDSELSDSLDSYRNAKENRSVQAEIERLGAFYTKTAARLSPSPARAAFEDLQQPRLGVKDTEGSGSRRGSPPQLHPEFRSLQEQPYGVRASAERDAEKDRSINRFMQEPAAAAAGPSFLKSEDLTNPTLVGKAYYYKGTSATAGGRLADTYTYKGRQAPRAHPFH